MEYKNTDGLMELNIPVAKVGLNADRTDILSDGTVIANSTDDSVFTYTSGILNQITKLATIDMTDASISSTVQFRLARTDVTVGDIDATFVDAHIEYDMNGSATEYSKF